MDGRERNVFGWLDDVRETPGMYLGTGSLKELESLIWGYCSGLSVHGIVETVPMMTRHFTTWLERRTKWSCCRGWSAAIEERFPDRDRATCKVLRVR